MSSGVAVALLLIIGTGLFVSFLRVPHWLCRSMLRHRLWRLRDTIVDDVLDGKLPANHPAVAELGATIETIIRETGNGLTMLNLYVYTWVKRNADEDVRKRLKYKAPDLDGLSVDQRKLVESYRGDVVVLGSGVVLFGTWLGLLTVVRFMPAALLEARRRAQAERHDDHRDTRPFEPDSPDLMLTFRAAAQKAAEGTRLGRYSRDLVSEERSRGAELAGVA